MINYLDGALLWPDQHGGRRVARGVALVSQSLQHRDQPDDAGARPAGRLCRLPRQCRAGRAGGDWPAALLDDDRVTALGLYVEGIGDAPAFAALAEAARARGQGDGGAEIRQDRRRRGAAAASHTASLAGGGAASAAFLRQAGVAEVATPAGTGRGAEDLACAWAAARAADLLAVLLGRRGGAGGRPGRGGGARLPAA